ncbi:aminopeptidase [[Clostridium] sordellii]|uniref:aminopeptidase n=1 Tax=Paraclostridium sordellii TaxID=1505 RepID=UPI0005DCB99A|nr:aminopeptidase [Paeniclostridium sordellii]MDU1455695.1 aminopeptidase [Paeniclostridium sordellii]CEO12339.1 aminopeptidase [[Clostridium] sordellii] [Paeniclostridium sordellii]
MNLERNLEKYAELSVKIGVNIQPGQTLLVRSPIECAPFVRKVVKKAYDLGAKEVFVEWSDEECTLIKYLNAPEDTFNHFPTWVSDQYVDIAKNGGAFLTVYAQDPDLLKDVDPQRVANFQKASAEALQEWRSYTLSDKSKWSIVSVPTANWSKKVFPGVSEEEAIDKMWEAIFHCTRVDQEDPIEAWNQHNKNLKVRMNFLNDSKFKTLYFKSDKTDITMNLPEGHIWASGASKDPNGINFNPNIPTEEVFTLPHKFGVNGVVASTKPLVYGGNVINNFTLTFKDGKIVDFTAEEGYETLSKLIDTDEGSHYLGEVALVPFKSPISDTNIVFYNTLYDENASCHFAIGTAYKSCIENGVNIPKEDLDKHGINFSITHVDFMIGSPDMNIVGEKATGEKVQIFKDGNWAF